MNKQRTYFRPTTAQQRRLLFETWEATGNVAEASRKALSWLQFSSRVFYADKLGNCLNWKKY